MSSSPKDLPGLPWNWGATADEIAGPWPCEGVITQPYRSLWRAVDVAAPVAVVYRWVCQMKVAPYSYDWIDNRGRRSPRTLTPGVEQVEVGQRMQIFEIVDFEPDVHITCRGLPSADRLFGRLALTYMARPVGEHESRLVARLDAGASSLPGRLRLRLLAWGDLVMMRKQLLTFKECAESTATRLDARPPGSLSP